MKIGLNEMKNLVYKSQGSSRIRTILLLISENAKIKQNTKPFSISMVQPYNNKE